MAYIQGENKPAHDEAGDDCPFCARADALGRGRPDRRARRRWSYAVLNLYPYNSGHLMIVPYRHVADYTDLDADETAELGAFTQHGDAVLRAVMAPHGFNIGHEPGRRWPAPASPRTCTSTSCRGGAATPTSCRSSRTRGCCRSCCPTPAHLLAEAWAGASPAE